jgi:hypothetical protein
MLLAAGCSHGGAGSLADLCALADLPSSTPAEMAVLDEQSTDRLTGHKGRAFANTSRNKRIFKAAVYLQVAASQAAVEAQASGSLKSLFPLLHSGEPAIIPTVSEAQSDLRSPCTG